MVGQARNKHLLVPTGFTENSSPGVKDRIKHQRLVGADIYIARLARPTPIKNSKAASRKEAQSVKNKIDDNAGHVQPDLPISKGSLHEELTCIPKEPTLSKAVAATSEDHPAVAESRPCYRCVAYMHSFGIKRAFWTTNDGHWEGAKVRDLVDELEGAMNRMDPSLGLPVPDVFVTKNEVLLLRRQMMMRRGS